MPLAFAAAVAGAFGATIGSFLNVVAYRLPRGESLVHPGSHCPGCDTAIKAYDNVPVLAWLWLRGRCRSCRTAISPRYPIVEALTAALAVAVVLTKHSAVEIVLGLVLVLVLVPIALIDFDHRIIPNKITLPAGVAAVAIGVALDLRGRPRAVDRRAPPRAGSCSRSCSPIRAGWAWATSSWRRSWGCSWVARWPSRCSSACSARRSSAPP